MSTILAWHFVGNTLRGGRPVPADGELLTEKKAILCAIGLHASVDAFDALQYAPGNILCRVKLGGKIVHGDAQVVATERTIVARIDATELMRSFARKQALKVKHLWDMPAVVEQYLLTGDESLRAAANASAYASADAAEAAAYAAAHASADAAYASAYAAAHASADASEAAADAAAYAANAAVTAAAYAARAGAYASEAAADAARAAARQDFNQMVAEAFAL